ncbi:MAG: hypothetical protein FJY37_13920 [Betaproteobacteria bacterium]|nr:hypothetical protein [Betaproteobacteria bacterium]
MNLSVDPQPIYVVEYQTPILIWADIQFVPEVQIQRVSEPHGRGGNAGRADVAPSQGKTSLSKVEQSLQLAVHVE